MLFCTYAADLRDHFQNIVLTILVSGSFIHFFFLNQKFPKVFQVHIFCLDEFYLKTFAPSDVVALLTRLLARVSAGFCCDKHPAVAVVPAKVWEEDSGFLWHHSKCTCRVARAFPKG